MNLPAPVVAVVTRFQVAHPPPNKPLPANIDDLRRAWTTRVAEQVRYTFGPAWGCKRASPTRPRSKDGLGFVAADGNLWVFDLVNGTTFVVNNPCAGQLAPGQTFDPVQPHDHLGLGVPFGGVPPVVPPDVPPQPPVEPPKPPVTSDGHTAVLAEIAALRGALVAEVGVLRATVHALDEHLAKLAPIVAMIHAGVYAARPVDARIARLGLVVSGTIGGPTLEQVVIDTTRKVWAG
jgi:hypothetical protein